MSKDSEKLRDKCRVTLYVATLNTFIRDEAVRLKLQSRLYGISL
jgi:hypothetical protein